jgi:hypothetical protein
MAGASRDQRILFGAIALTRTERFGRRSVSGLTCCSGIGDPKTAIHDRFSFDVARTAALDQADTIRAVRYNVTAEIAG